MVGKGFGAEDLAAIQCAGQWCQWAVSRPVRPAKCWKPAGCRSVVSAGNMGDSRLGVVGVDLVSENMCRKEKLSSPTLEHRERSESFATVVVTYMV